MVYAEEQTLQNGVTNAQKQDRNDVIESEMEAKIEVNEVDPAVFC